MCNRRAVARKVWPLLAAAATAAACIPSLPERPASLDAPGVRVGGEWLVASTPYPNVRSGLVSQIVRREGSGELVIIGNDAAVFLPRDGGLPRVVGFVPQAGHAELLEWPGELPRFVDSGGGGWQLGGLYGPEGRRLWQPDQDAGMDDLAAGDRSQLFVFDASGARVYHEVLPGQCVALAASDPNALLLGCGERVLRYEPRARPQG